MQATCTRTCTGQNRMRACKGRFRGPACTVWGGASASLPIGLAPLPLAPPFDPLARPGLVRILLGPTASQVLTATGEKVFALVASETYPGDPSRWVILVVPVPLDVARQAASVALGRMIATKPRKPTQAIRKGTAAPTGPRWIGKRTGQSPAKERGTHADTTTAASTTGRGWDMR